MEHNYHTLYSRDYPNYDNNYLDKNILDESGLSIFFYNGIYYLFTCLMMTPSWSMDSRAIIAPSPANFAI